MTIDYLLILNLQVDSELKVLNGNREERLLLSNIVDPAILSQLLDLKTERKKIWLEILECAVFGSVCTDQPLCQTR